jgi:hypothetical protein
MKVYKHCMAPDRFAEPIPAVLAVPSIRWSHS